VPAGPGERRLQRVQLGGAHAPVDAALDHGQDIDAGVVQEPLEPFAEIVVEDRPTLVGTQSPVLPPFEAEQTVIFCDSIRCSRIGISWQLSENKPFF
jgi:hypothetical protein